MSQGIGDIGVRTAPPPTRPPEVRSPPAPPRRPPVDHRIEGPRTAAYPAAPLSMVRRSSPHAPTSSKRERGARGAERRGNAAQGRKHDGPAAATRETEGRGGGAGGLHGATYRLCHGGTCFRFDHPSAERRPVAGVTRLSGHGVRLERQPQSARAQWHRPAVGTHPLGHCEPLGPRLRRTERGSCRG